MPAVVNLQRKSMQIVKTNNKKSSCFSFVYACIPCCFSAKR